jgi:hypothetical protein
MLLLFLRLLLQQRLLAGRRGWMAASHAGLTVVLGLDSCLMLLFLLLHCDLCVPANVVKRIHGCGCNQRM